MAFLTSFSELAKVMGCKVKAAKVVKLDTYSTIVDTCGRKAATIWAFMQDRESCKRYGPNGAILHTMENLQEATGYESGIVASAVINLIAKGFARPAANGTQVKAA